MPEAGAVLPGAQPPESFFGRVCELKRLRLEARALLRGRGRSRALLAAPGSGKTELLLQWHGTLFREGEILPFYWSVPAGAAPASLAADCARQFALQAWAFRRRDAALLAQRPSRESLAAGLGAAYGGAGALLLEEIARFSPAAAGAPTEPFGLVPHRFSLAANTRVLWMIDDLGNLGSPAACAAVVSAAAAASATAPLLLALDDDAALAALLGPSAARDVTLERLGPLSAEALFQIVRQLARAHGLQLGEEAVAALEREAAGSPFYLAALVRALADREGGAGPLEVARAAASSVCDGELARYWFDRLAAHLPERSLRGTALEILAYCLREEGESPEAGRLAARMLKSEAEVDAALAALQRAGVVRIDCARVAVAADPVLREAVLARYRREFEGASPAVVAAACAAAKVRGAAATARRRAAERFRESLATLLLAWDGRQVPRALFDAAAHARRPAGDAARAADVAPEIVLPRVVSVASSRVGSAGSPAACELDALAWGVRGEAGARDADVAWVARRMAGGPGSAQQLAAFDAEIAALQAAGELPAERLVRWALLDAPPDAEGEREAARLRLMTSTHAQLAALAEALGAPAPPRPEPSAGGAAPRLEMEMVIPRAADAELVAARALEQFAENIGMGPEEAGRTRTALVEACINAFEHSGDRDGRVRLWFAVAGGRLVIRVENRGRALAALPAPAAADDQPRRRGWGLTLIRQLIDEVRIEPREDGVSLVMEKEIGVQAHG